MAKKIFSKKAIALSVTCLSATTVLGNSSIAVEGNSENPVLLELFTSEGCSSCPPAERLVKQLSQEMGDGVIILSEHVDYWNHLGWKDPFARKDFTKRQYHYAKHFGSSGVYTPQVVINGTTQAVGSNRGAVVTAIQKGKKVAKAKLTQSVTKKPQSRQVETAIQINKMKGVSFSEPVNVSAALVKKEASTMVKRGENFGRHLRHANVVLELKTMPLKDLNSNSSHSVTFDTRVKNLKDAYSVVAFVQGAKSGQIYVANMEKVK